MKQERKFYFSSTDSSNKDEQLALSSLKLRLDKRVVVCRGITLDQDNFSYSITSLGGFGPSRGLGSRVINRQTGCEYSADITSNQLSVTNQDVFIRKEERMSEVMRLGFDGSLERTSFPLRTDVNPELDPFDGSVVRYIERATLDGIELVPVRVITSNLTAEEVTKGIVFAAEEIIKNHQKGVK